MMCFIPENSLQTEYKIKKSRFTAYIRFCESKLDFKSWLSRIKRFHYDANHICWAYIIVEYGINNYFSSDGGEPSGTAGRPILKVLKKNELIQSAIIIVRNIKGAKLGRKGLMNAYEKAASKVVQKTKLIDWKVITKYIIKCPIEFYNKVIHLITVNDGKILTDESSDLCVITLEIALDKKDDLFQKIHVNTRNKSEIIRM